MQLFSRTVHLVGPPAQTMTYASDMREYVAGATGRDIALWSAGLGAPLGTMVYTTRVEGLADIQQTFAGLMQDEAYHAKLAAGRDYFGGPAEDNLGQPVYGELGEAPPVGSLAVVTSAVMANGRYADAIGWGVDVAQHVEKLTGMTTAFLTNEFGPFGRVTWIGVLPNAAAADASSATVNGDADYLTKLHHAADLFLPGSGHRTLLTRVG